MSWQSVEDFNNFNPRYDEPDDECDECSKGMWSGEILYELPSGQKICRECLDDNYMQSCEEGDCFYCEDCGEYISLDYYVIDGRRICPDCITDYEVTV